MSIFEYYFELLDKPRYMLTEAEDTFLTLFPLIVLAAVACVIALVACVIALVAAIVDKIRNK